MSARPGRRDRSKRVFSRLIGGIEELPEDIELELIGSGIADAHPL
jgi:hypothetical protein